MSNCKTIFSFSFLIAIGWLVDSGCATSGSIQKGPSAIFDGNTFNGWSGNMEFFRIQDGAVVAGRMNESIPRNEFLCTEKLYGDFELRVKAKLQGKGDNAGIQFRTSRIPDHHEVIGYQCDMGSDPGGKIWGFIYDESRRRKFLTDVDREAILKVLDIDGWNELTIRAKGARIQIWLNGYQTVDFTEDEDSVSRTGVICLQIHSGPPAEASYKDLMIYEL